MMNPCTKGHSNIQIRTLRLPCDNQGKKWKWVAHAFCPECCKTHRAWGKSAVDYETKEEAEEVAARYWNEFGEYKYKEDET